MIRRGHAGLRAIGLLLWLPAMAYGRRRSHGGHDSDFSQRFDEVVLYIIGGSLALMILGAILGAIWRRLTKRSAESLARERSAQRARQRAHTGSANSVHPRKR